MTTLPKYVVIVGSGKFAKVFAEKIESFSEKLLNHAVHPLSWGNRIEVKSSVGSPKLDDLKPEELAFLHVGSGREFPDVLDHCKRRNLLLVEASTGEYERPKETSFPYVEAPNLSLPIVKLFCLLERGKGLFSGMKKEILESHQISKKSLPGTARHFAELLDVDSSSVESVRDPQRQTNELEIPKEHLNGHALHRICIEGDGAEIMLGTKILGRDTYVYGLLEILRIRDQLEGRRYFVSELIDEGLL